MKRHYPVIFRDYLIFSMTFFGSRSEKRTRVKKSKVSGKIETTRGSNGQTAKSTPTMRFLRGPLPVY